MSWDTNPYYHPEKFTPPLRTVAVLDAYEPDYSFDIFLVVQDIATNKVYVAADSGCSCPVPFEDHNSLGDFSEVHSWEDIKREYDSRFPEGSYRQRAAIQSIRNACVRAFRRG